MRPDTKTTETVRSCAVYCYCGDVRENIIFKTKETKIAHSFSCFASDSVLLKFFLHRKLEQHHATPRHLYHLGKIVVYLDIFIAFVDVLWPLLFIFMNINLPSYALIFYSLW